MCSNQKFAWFNLAVIAFTLSVFFGLVPLLGWQRAQGALGIAGLMGFGPLWFWKKRGQVAMDERDQKIHFHSWAMAAGVMLWLVYVFVAVFLVPAVYGQDGAVPVSVVQVSVYWSWLLANTVMSIAILVQYARASSDVQ